MSANKHNYKADLLARLKDLRYAVFYLSASVQESQETFFLALRDVAEAQKGIAQLAVDANVNRENLYRLLSEDGNPQYSTFLAVLDALGIVQDFKLKESLIDYNEPPNNEIEITTLTGGIPIGFCFPVKTKDPVGYVLDSVVVRNTQIFSVTAPCLNTEMAKAA